MQLTQYDLTSAHVTYTNHKKIKSKKRKKIKIKYKIKFLLILRTK